MGINPNGHVGAHRRAKKWVCYRLDSEGNAYDVETYTSANRALKNREGRKLAKLRRGVLPSNVVGPMRAVASWKTRLRQDPTARNRRKRNRRNAR